MIDIPVVLVLGAGASLPYGLPLGDELMEEACTGSTTAIARILHRCWPAAAHQLEEFRRKLRGSKCDSIDEFLEGRLEYEDVGKAVIAYYLVRHEHEGKLFGSEREVDWYRYLLNKLMLTEGFAGFGHNKLSVITYNYDRSLEAYILSVLQDRYGKSRAECVEAFSPIRIIHVHGKLGELTETDNGGRRFDREVDERRLSVAMKGIRIAHDESLDQDPVFTKARKLLSEAHRVIFLGFGYLKDNVDRLRLDENRKSYTTYHGTGVEVRPKEAEIFAQLFPPPPYSSSDQTRITIDTKATSVLDYLRNNPHLFRK